MLSVDEIEEKGSRMAAYGGSSFAGERVKQFFKDVWSLEKRKDMLLMQ